MGCRFSGAVLELEGSGLGFEIAVKGFVGREPAAGTGNGHMGAFDTSWAGNGEPSVGVTGVGLCAHGACDWLFASTLVVAEFLAITALGARVDGVIFPDLACVVEEV
jgi:hypothetical protein